MNTKHVKSANQYSQLPEKKLYTHRLFLIISIMLTTASVFAQTDKVDCKEHPLIPTRLPDYYIVNCEVNDYSAHTVITQQGEKTIEGKKTVLEYFLKPGGKADQHLLQ